MNKFDRFQLAAESSGVVLAVREKFGKWGEFQVDNADVIVNLVSSHAEAALVAVTWMNETTFRFYSEPNTNNSDDFEFWDVGPMQLNVRTIRANVANRFLNAASLNLDRAFGTKNETQHGPWYNGDPIENIKVGRDLLLRIGRGTITGPSETILYPKLTQEEWDSLSEHGRNERRAVAYTGPEARPSRYRSWVKFGPLFQRFFQVYGA